MCQAVHTMRETAASLLQSIREHGAFLPVYRWRGEVIDGRKREEILISLGRAVDYRDLYSEEQARCLLWRHHPERALQRWPQPTATAAARAFCCRVADAVHHFPTKRQRFDRERSPGRRTGQRARGLDGDPVRYNVWLNRDVLESAKKAAQESGLSMPRFLRACLALVVTRPELVQSVKVLARLQ